MEHGVDTDIFKFLEKKNSSHFTVMYSGALVESYDFKILFQAAKKLKNENIQFIIRGKGPLLKEIIQKKNELRLNNLKIDSQIVDYDKISNVLSASDVFLVPMKNDYFLNLSLPTKILEYQALGRPIICCSNGAPGNYVKNTNSGISIPSENIIELINAIKNLKSDNVMCKSLGENGFHHICNYLTFEKINARLTELIEA